MTEEADWLDAFSGHLGSAAAMEGAALRGAPDGLPHDDVRAAGPSWRASWLDSAWGRLTSPERAAAVLLTPSGLGGVGRSEVRSLRRSAAGVVGKAQIVDAPSLRGAVDGVVGESSACSDARVRRVFPPSHPAARALVMIHMGYDHPRTWDGRLLGFWTATPTLLDLQLRSLARGAPVAVDEAERIATRLGIAADVPWWDLLSSPNGPLVTRLDGWGPRPGPSG